MEEATQKGMEIINELTPEQERKWEDTLSMMAWKCPGFRHILFKMLNGQRNSASKYIAVWSREVPIAATDAQNLIFNPDIYFDVGLPQRVYVGVHEIIHNVYGDVELLQRCARTGKVPMHDGSFLPFDNPTLQRSMDARINALLDQGRIGMRLDTYKGKPIGWFDQDVKAEDSCLDIYKKYYEEKFGKDPPGKDPGGQPGNQPSSGGGNPGGFDNLLPPGQVTGKPHHRDQGSWQVAIHAAQSLEQARAQGKMAAELKRMFADLLEPEVPWVDHIETEINRVVGDEFLDWTVPHPWLGDTDTGDQYFVPSPTGCGAGWVVVWGDTSGSMGNKELTANMSELAGIMEQVRPKRLTVLWCDAAVSFVDELTDPSELNDIQARGAGGGGGTNYAPVREWIAAQHDTPDLFIGFTDGYVDHAKHEPDYPVIWACNTDKPFPWGKVIRIGRQAREL